MLAGNQSETERYFETISKRVAKLAVAALHKLSKPKKELEGKVKSGSKSKSVLEKIRERRSVNDEIEAPLSNTDIFKKSKLNPNYKLARQLRLGSDSQLRCSQYEVTWYTILKLTYLLNPLKGTFFKNQNGEN